MTLGYKASTIFSDARLPTAAVSNPKPCASFEWPFNNLRFLTATMCNFLCGLETMYWARSEENNLASTLSM